MRKGLKMRNKILDAVIRKYGYENWRTVLVFKILGR